LAHLPQMLQGLYDVQALGRMVGVAALAALAVSFVGMLGFARSDV
jgi:hypothetical protein